mgnify:CR=1 FL=1
MIQHDEQIKKNAAVTIGNAGGKIHPAFKSREGDLFKLCACATKRGGFSNALALTETTGAPNCKR